MITAGIIAEYNPFHRGHQYHIEETRRQTGADFIVAVMSGDYVQRGEPAIVDKYLRTRMALHGGADLVLELPVIYASASAEYFASAGVQLLHNLHSVDYLSFGSEKAGIKDFEPLVKFLSEELDFYKKQLREELKRGKNFPLAREDALKAYVRKFCPETRIFWGILEEPNHILGLEYLKALHRLQSPIVPVTIRRQGAGYHDVDMDKKYPSASAIRKMLAGGEKLPAWGKMSVSGEKISDGKKEPLEGENAADTRAMLCRAMGGGAGEFLERWRSNDTTSWESLMPFLSYTVLMGERPEDIFGFDRDMAARFLKLYRPGMSLPELIGVLHTKRLTDAAWRRALLHLVLHIKKEDYLFRAAEIPVPYARVLGFSKRAAPLLKKIREKSSIPLLQRPAEGKTFAKDSAAERIFAADVRAAELYEQVSASRSGRSPISEWVRQQIIIEREAEPELIIGYHENMNGSSH